MVLKRRRRLRTLYYSCATLLVVAFAGACSAERSSYPAPEPRTIRIVSSLPARGIAAQEARQVRQGIDLAIRSSSPTFAHVTLDSGDTENGEFSRRREEANAEAAASDPSVIAYIGPLTSSGTGASLPITSRAGLTQIGLAATWPGLTDDGWNPGEPGQYYPVERNYFRLSAPDSWQASAAAELAKVIAPGAVAVLDDGSSYSAGLARQFELSAGALDIDIQTRASLDDYLSATGPVNREGQGSSAVFFAASTATNAVRLLSANRAAGDLNYVLSDTAMTPDVLDAAGQIDADVHVIFNGRTGIPYSAKAREFANLYQATWNEEPTYLAARAYDATQLVLRTSERAPTRDEVLRAMREAGPYEGVSGNIRFSSRGDNLDAPFSVYAVGAQGFKLERVLEGVGAGD